MHIKGTDVIIIGSLVNAAAVVVGGGIGVLFKGRIPAKISENITRAIGLCVCVIGISGALGGNIMLMVGSLALGALSGELLKIDEWLNRFGMWLQRKISRGSAEGSTFAEGFVSATLLFCVGAMAIVGAIDSGLRGDRSILFTKSILDGVSAIVFASSFGTGVLFSAAVLLIYEGAIEFFAGFLQNVFTTGLITQISAVGSVMIIAIGLNMVLGAKIKVANLLPGLIFAGVFYWIFGAHIG